MKQRRAMPQAGNMKTQFGGRQFAKVLLASSVLSCVWTLTCSSAFAQAQPAAASSQGIIFQIPAQPLSSAISAFINQSGWQISYSSELVRGRRSSELSGSLTPVAALQRLVAGTGISVRVGSTGSAALIDPKVGAVDAAAVGEGSIILDTITVQGQGATTEGTGSYTTPIMSTATKMPLSIRETPQSVSVVTDQKIKDRNYNNLNEALNDATGIVAAQGFGDTRWEYFARGDYISNIQYDGVSNPVNLFTRDVIVQDNLAIYDHVEIIRGATGLTEGSGNPSASINLVRKRPTKTPQYSIETTASSFGNARATFDASGPLNAAGTLRGRFVASGGLGDGYRDYYEQKNLTLYGVIDADITEDTTISLGFSHQRENIDGYTWGGLPTRADGSFYNYTPKTYLGSDWEYLKKKQNTFYADLEHRFDNGWKLNATARRIWADSDMLSAFTWRFNDQLRKNDRLYDYNDDLWSGDVHVSGPIELFGRNHDVVIGISTQREKHSYVGGSAPFYVIDPENWNPTSVPKPNITLGAFSGDLDQNETGIYASTRLNIADPFKVILGGRLSWYKNNDLYSDQEYSENANFIPYIGAVYDLNDTFSIYGSYTSIFKPQMAYGINGELLDPVKGNNKEIGIKGEFLGGLLNASVAVFETNQTGLATELEDITYCNPAAYTCYEAADKVRTRGVELEVTGEITNNLNVGVGYTYSKSKYVEGENSGTHYNTEKMPAQIFKASATYRLPGDYEKWTIGGAMRAQSKLYYQGSNFRIQQPGYALVDVMAKYAFTEQTELQLNVNNLFDKQYYSAISGLTSYGAFIGAPREFTVSLRHKF